MIRTISNAAAGGAIPRCCGFRLKARQVSPVPAAGLTPPWPVKLRDMSGGLQHDFLVWDSAFYRAAKPNPDASGRDSIDGRFGPFIIDPDSASPGWAWDVTWCDEHGHELEPVPDEPRTELVWDSGTIGGGAQVQTPVIQMSRYERASLLVTNGDAATRAINFTVFTPEGASIGGGNFANVSAGGIWQLFGLGLGGVANFTAILPTHLQLTMLAGAGGNGRMVVYGRR